MIIMWLFNVLCAGLKYKKMLVFSYLVLKHFIIDNGDHSK